MFFFLQQTFSLSEEKPFSQYKLVRWDSVNGLPQNLVLAMRQTHDGYIWFGTQEGLARFNGTTFKVFDMNNTPTLKSGFISTLFEDSAGQLWIGTPKGLHLYKNGEFLFYNTESGLAGNSVNTFYEDSKGNLWIGTSKGISCFAGGKFVSYSTKDGLSNDVIRSITEDSNGDLWFATADGLNRFHENQFQKFTTDDGLPSNALRTIYRDADNRIWIGSFSGLSEWKDGKFINDPRFNGKEVRRIIGDKNGLLIVGGEFGISWFKGDNIVWTLSGKEIMNGGTYSMLLDSEGSLWFGTEGDGLRQLIDTKFGVYSNGEGLSDDVTFSMFQNASGDIWISTGKGVSRFRENTFDLNLLRMKELPDERIVSILDDGANGLWIGNTDGVLQWSNGKIIRPRNSDSVRKQSGVVLFCLYRDLEQNLWVGTSKGLRQIKGSRENAEIINYTQFESLASAVIYGIQGSLSKGLWLGTSKGLFLLKDNNLTQFTTKEGLPSNTLVSLYEDPTGVLWIGTFDSGLCRYKDGKFTSVSTKNGLFNNIVYAVLPDNLGNFWITCNRGIYRVNENEVNEFLDGKRENITSVVYGTADGLRNPECNGGFQPSALKSDDGKLWFPTIKGVAVIDPKNYRQNLQQPPVNIED